MLEWQEIQERAIAFRHRLHQTPELTWQEKNTTATIRQQLTALEIEWQACTETGTLGRLAKNKPGPHIALRGDIDALPIHEQSGVDWCSTTEGCMHACGHDGHTASLMATAMWLKQHEEQLPGPVTLVFQPAEEGGHGAKAMIAEGALKGIDAIYGWHNWPAVPLGQAICPDGPVMSANSLFTISVAGIGGHASQPEACRDPVLAGCAINLALQQVVSRFLPPQTAGVLSVTSFDAKSAQTVIPKQAVLSGGVRASSSEVRDFINEKLSEIACHTAKAYGCEASVEHTLCYGATTNHAAQAESFRLALQEEFGHAWRCDSVASPIMASEDFSYFLNEIPGAFALIGTHTDGKYHHPCHSPHYDFNDALIPHVVRLYSRLVGAPVPA
ncbi:putative hydrolase YxeP [Thalassocella blandensis]|nr:putative hydrolase YxeP [Thalassocella blandensis]